MRRVLRKAAGARGASTARAPAGAPARRTTARASPARSPGGVWRPNALHAAALVAPNLMPFLVPVAAAFNAGCMLDV
jgi:hypothetical protein